MKSVHIGLNKRHFIYIYDKINLFSCPGCTCDCSFLPTEGSVEDHSAELFGLEAHSLGSPPPPLKSNMSADRVNRDVLETNVTFCHSVPT